MADGSGAGGSDPVVEERSPLSVAADLTVTVDGEVIDFWSAHGGETLVVQAPSFRAAQKLARFPLPGPLSLDGGARALAAGDVTVEIRVRHATVARVGPDSRPGTLSRVAARFVEIPEGVSLDPFGVAVAAARRLF